MKKLLLFFAAAAMAVSFSACSENPDDNGENGDNTDNSENVGGNNPSDDNNDPSPEDLKLVKQIKCTESWDSDVFTVITEFGYDSQNRIVEIIERYDYEEGGDRYTFSYDGNKLTVHDYRDDEEYTVLLNSDGCIKSIDNWDFFEYDDNGYMILRYKEDERGRENTTYTWSNGNLVSIYSSDYYNDSYTSTIVYDDTLTLVPTNINLLHALGVIEHDDYWLMAFGQWGRQCKNLPVRIEYKNSESWSDTIDYELNADGSIAKITHKGKYMRGTDTYEILYY